MTTVVTTGKRVERFFADVGNQVASLWRACDLERAAFSQIATDELTRRRPCDELGYEDILDWALSTETLPFQQEFESQFGQPPLTLYWHPRFYIQALFWATSTTAIHNHAFAGAFSILEGSSLQTTFTFKEERRINEYLSIGQLDAVDSIVLGKGATQEITPGDQFIHSAWHIDMPSVTIVVRTHSETYTEPRREYLPPAVAMDPFWSDQQLSRRLQCLQLLATLQSPSYEAHVLALIASGDIFSAYMAVRQFCANRINDRERCRAVVGAVTARWPSVHSVVAHVYDETVRRAVCSEGRRARLGPRAKLLLGLLLTLRDRQSVLDAFAASCREGDAATELVSLVGALAGCGVLPFDIDEESARMLVTTGTTLGGMDANSSRQQQLFESVILQPLFR